VKKFGCISPSVVQLPWDITAALPQDLGVAVVTLNVRNGRPGEQERAVSIMRGASDVLIDEGCGAIVAFGVPVSARRGFAAEREALEELTADRGAVPIVSSLHASALGLRELSIRRPLFVTQYAPDVNDLLVAFYRDAGLEPVGAVGLGARNAAEVNALSSDDFYELARRAIRDYPSAEGIFLSARGNLLNVALKLEAEIERPVVDQVQAAVWWARSVLDVPPRKGTGRLLASAAYLSANVS
jgi:maleate cis-trans isomerase